MKLLNGIDCDERLYPEMLACNAEMGQQDVAVILYDNVIERYSEPRPKRSEDCEGFSGR